MNKEELRHMITSMRRRPGFISKLLTTMGFIIIDGQKIKDEEFMKEVLQLEIETKVSLFNWLHLCTFVLDKDALSDIKDDTYTDWFAISEYYDFTATEVYRFKDYINFRELLYNTRILKSGVCFYILDSFSEEILRCVDEDTKPSIVKNIKKILKKKQTSEHRARLTEKYKSIL